MTRGQSGFSFIELIVASAIVLLTTATVVRLSVPAQGLFSAQSDVADMQQRLRVAIDTLTKDLSVAGAGGYSSVNGAALDYSFAPIRPYRSGARGADPPGSYKDDTISISYVPRSTGAMVTSVYSLKGDAAAGTYQLVMYDGSANPDVPVVDNVVALAFEYYADARPPTMRKPLAAPVGPWTTYGPAPSAVAVAPFAAGENCAFANDGSPDPVPRLSSFGASSDGLVKLAAAQLTDGPWCPDDGAVEKWDADLLRIRRVAVTLRVQAAVASLRGPAGLLFTHGGTARSSTWVPDQEIRFDVAPRNLNLGR
jgi:prepilin-type N-terminal cleavage/methylation domain-containing protein